MKTARVNVWVLYCIFFLSFLGIKAQNKSVLHALQTKQFNEAAAQLKPYNGPHQALYQGIVQNAFNQNHASIQSLLQQPITDLPDSLKFVYYKTMNDNYAKIQDYKLAYQTGKLLVNKYGHFFTKEVREDEIDAVKIWKNLRKILPQTILKSGDARLPFTRDLAGLHTVPVTIGKTMHNFVFDTGAGISCLTDSYAQLLNVKILSKESIHVDGGTGASNAVRIGVVPQLSLGNIRVQNAVFMVFPDSAFSFADGAYKINGVIGFPIISGLGKITMTEDSIFIPATVPAKQMAHHNLAFVEMSPIIYLRVFEQEIPCLFDTGDADFSFSSPFYHRFSSQLQGEIAQRTVAGAGGEATFQAFIAKPFPIFAGNQLFSPDQISIDMENEHIVGPEIYGNIGQGIIKRFQRTTIDFVNAEIWFE